jgi:hypothetical protein
MRHHLAFARGEAGITLVEQSRFPDEFALFGSALQQIKDKNYADKYNASGSPIYLIGVEFSKQNRNIVGLEVEQV